MPLTTLLTSLGLAYARVPMQRHATDTLLDGMLVLHSSKNTIFAEVRFTDALWHCACVPWHHATACHAHQLLRVTLNFPRTIIFPNIPLDI